MNDLDSNTESKRYVVLSIDGGGIRGLIPATVLVNLEKMIQGKRGDKGKIGDYFDFIAGTSTGGLLACLFLCPDPNDAQKAKYSASDAKQLYLEYGDSIFDRDLWQRMQSLNGLKDEKYNASNLEKVVFKYVGDNTLKNLIKPCLITGYDVRLYQPIFFTQQDADDPKSNYPVKDVMRATSAAPTYFEPALPKSLDGINNETPVIDGGVFANNPTACAFVEVLKKGHGVNQGVPVEEIVILSLGTGRQPTTITYNQCKDWGLINWARPVLDIMMEGVSQTVDYQMRYIFESMKKSGQYLRVDGEFGDYKNRLAIQDLNPAMDCATKENMQRLCTFGDQLTQNYFKQLTDFVNKYL